MLGKEYIFQIASTPVTFLPKSTFKIARKLGASSQHFYQHVFLLDTGAEGNVVNKAIPK